MRQRLLTAIAERDHYLAALKRHGIDAGPPPVPPPSPAPVAAGSATAAPTGDPSADPSVPASAADDAAAPGPGSVAVPRPSLPTALRALATIAPAPRGRGEIVAGKCTLGAVQRPGGDKPKEVTATQSSRSA